MNPFLVSYHAQAAVIMAPAKTDARNFFQEKFLKNVDGVDKRKIATTELLGLEWGGPELKKPKVLKTVVLVEG